jgi:hypothetical protein
MGDVFMECAPQRMSSWQKSAKRDNQKAAARGDSLAYVLRPNHCSHCRIESPPAASADNSDGRRA